MHWTNQQEKQRVRLARTCIYSWNGSDNFTSVNYTFASNTDVIG